MARWWVLGLCGFGAMCLAPASLAQSMDIDAQKEPKSPSIAKPPSSEPPPPIEQVIRPIAVSTPVNYPAKGQGAQEVVLELTISKVGAVTQAIAVRGDPLFAQSAVEAARSWKFHPATRGGTPLAVKIRFAVRFVPPIEEPDARTSDDNTPSASTPPPTPAPEPTKPKVYEVVVRGTREPIRHQLSRAEIREMPGAFGDPYRAIEALPGVVPIVSGLPYFYVRGAPPGNVGYFFDGVPVPYLYHFAAGPGVLHPAFVDHVDLYPGAYPVRYGRFAGAIVAGEMAPPGYRFRGEASIRLIDSGAMIEAPFANGRGSVMLGGRYSYTALIISLIVPNVTLNYWDYQARSRYEIDNRNSVEVLVFGSGDYLSTKETAYEPTSNPGTAATAPTQFQSVTRENTVVDVGFHRLDLRWDRHVSQGNWRNAVMVGLDRTRFDNGSVTVTNRIVGGRSEFAQRPEDGIELRAGADVLFESLSQKFENGTIGGGTTSVPPGPNDPTQPNPAAPTPEPTVTPSGTSNLPDFGFDRARKDFTAGTWADIVLDISRNLQITPGLRLDLFVSGDRAAVGVDPRISARYKLSKSLTVVHGLAVVHQAPSFVVPVPGLKPSLAGGLQSAVQHSAGVSRMLPAGFEASATVFQNAFFNMTDYISLVQLENTNGREVTDFRTLGHAYGAEFMLRRSLARDLGGFVSYTLSRSLRSARQLQGPATTDRTHVLNVAASHNLGRNWRLGGRWLFYTGIPARVAYAEAARTPPRTPPFWRLDFKLQKRWIIAPPNAWWGLALEVLNTTLNKESLSGSCNAYSCKYEAIGPVTIPSIGAEGAF